MRTFIFMSFAFLALTACQTSTTTSEWSCPSPTPQGCFDVQSGDDLALNALSSDRTATVHVGKIERKNTKKKTVPLQNATKDAMIFSFGLSGEHVRLPEELAKIWIGPFVDEAGHWHAGSYMIIQIQPPRWHIQG